MAQQHRMKGLLQRALTLLHLQRDQPHVVHLDDVRRRLELLLCALYGRSIPITTAEPADARGVFARAVGALRRKSRSELAGTDGVHVYLPKQIALDTVAGLRRYQLLAIEQ